ncbi:hypothetical protein RRF57_011643 [Xylaria bambusicola]|uniref:Uncharacterized protein n=1 Tax=Xylaria bambusicola TaxID=326684 RepID=A0AAN7ZD98_9PEZI
MVRVDCEHRGQDAAFALGRWQWNARCRVTIIKALEHPWIQQKVGRGQDGDGRTEHPQDFFGKK